VIKRSDGPGTRPDNSAGGLAETRNGRGATVVSLIRRCGRIARVATHRSAKVAWYSATRTLRPHGMDQSGSFPNQLRLAFENLGPTFVKLGQVLSERSDITPPAVRQELSKLQDHAQSIPRVELLDELSRSHGPDANPFAMFEMVPAACGSIAEVHRATLRSGIPVAVKVRRPGIRATIENDIWLLDKLARMASFLSSRIRPYDPASILGEFASLLRAETDFTSEARNIEAVARTFAASDIVTIPHVFADISDESVLVMDWVDGTPLTREGGLESVGANPAGLARSILQAYGVMIFQSDRFHADPHPGNIIAVGGERFGLIDFGEVGSVGSGEQSALLEMMGAVIARDEDTLAKAVLSVSRTTRDVDRTEFGAQLAAFLDLVVDANLNNMRIGETLAQLLDVLRKNGIVLPSDLAVLVKTLVECEATTEALDPTMSMLSLVGNIRNFASSPPTASP
jgi:ubiquinone biosynthesis protein